jgi:hypothetical protein
MIRKLSLWCFFTLVLCVGTVFAQKHPLPRLALKTWRPAPKATASSAMNAAKVGKFGLPLFNYAVDSSRDHNRYAGAIVGKAPFDNGGGTVKVHTQIVPVVIVTEVVATDLSADQFFSTGPGRTRSDPTKADHACLTAPNNIPTRLLEQSPILTKTDFSFGGTNVGKTQYIDAFQRAQFWEVINRNSYHLNLAPVTTLAPVVIHVPAASGLSIPADFFGLCGSFGIVDINFFDAFVSNVIMPTLAAKGVNPGTFPIFQLYNVALSVGDPRDLFNNCCVGGYHSFEPNFQTYSPALFDTTGFFGPEAENTAIMAHEVGEWANDPSGFNPTPAWGHTGQVGGCQNNLEVGDPLTGTDIPPVTMPNGFTYNLQELAFFSWFYGAPTLGLNGWFSNNGTFLTDAGPPCT